MSDVLLITDRSDPDPAGLQSCMVPVRLSPTASFTTEEYLSAPLVLLDDRSFRAFTTRHPPRRCGLIVIRAALDDATVYHRAAGIGAEAVLTAEQAPSWLLLRLHEATECRYVDWGLLLEDRPDPPTAVG
ncbi:hypothetical protein [Streptomyces flavofungini]|uniref:Rv3660c-like CheY-like N-terminal domain-containing protein n=1 Tax=Streptomyces flavofungini TaxID=68200 RepID=A0ABS0XGF7_9ACTN|nr:hypothetical protein [Streptomyces flavofungini]MBJ3812313.1 hypothetical protein [Streptomyces flavofungini]GHC88518.1 hypothetical protein GCM10010349_75850 [Streptomyces flavofungini]